MIKYYLRSYAYYSICPPDIIICSSGYTRSVYTRVLLSLCVLYFSLGRHALSPFAVSPVTITIAKSTFVCPSLPSPSTLS